MEIWERLARKVKKELAASHMVKWDKKNKIAKFYRIANFSRGGVEFGPLPYAPYEGKEEILIYGNENKALVRQLGFGYYRLNGAIKKAFDELGIGPLQKLVEEGMEYYWKRH